MKTISFLTLRRPSETAESDFFSRFIPIFTASVELEVFGKIGECNLFQTCCRTALGAQTASRTLGVVDDGTVVDNRDGMLGAGLFTLLASDASVFACLARVGTLVLAVAVNRGCRLLRDHGDDLLGAFLGAQTATDTAARIDSRDTVFHADGMRNTDLGTVSASDTTVSTGLGTAIDHGACLAGGDTVINSFLRNRIAGSVTMYECHFVLGLLDLDSEDRAKLCGHGFRAGDAEVGLGIALGNRLGIVVTALVAAGTAVDTGERVSYFFGLFVLFDAEEVDEQGKQNTEEEADRYHNGKRGQYINKHI